MSVSTQILLVVPCVLSCITTAIYAYIAYQNFKRPKDEIWETAVRLSVANGKFTDANQFAKLYEELKFFKDNGCSLNGEYLRDLMQHSQLPSEQQRQSNREN